MFSTMIYNDTIIEEDVELINEQTMIAPTEVIKDKLNQMKQRANSIFVELNMWLYRIYDEFTNEYKDGTNDIDEIKLGMILDKIHHIIQYYNNITELDEVYDQFNIIVPETFENVFKYVILGCNCELEQFNLKAIYYYMCLLVQFNVNLSQCIIICNDFKCFNPINELYELVFQHLIKILYNKIIYNH